MTKIIPNTKTPDLSVPLLGGGQWTLSEQSPESFTMIVFYRGYHCPKCQQQLEELQGKLAEFKKLGVDCIALSMDSEDRAQKSFDEWDIKAVPFAYNLEEKAARDWGLYMSKKMDKPAEKTQEPQVFNEPGLFLVRPDQTLYAASLQTMPFARSHFQDLINAITFIKSSNYPARGDLK